MRLWQESRVLMGLLIKYIYIYIYISISKVIIREALGGSRMIPKGHRNPSEQLELELQMKSYW